MQEKRRLPECTELGEEKYGNFWHPPELYRGANMEAAMCSIAKSRFET